MQIKAALALIIKKQEKDRLVKGALIKMYVPLDR